MELALSFKINRKKEAQPELRSSSTLSNPAQWLLNFFGVGNVTTSGINSEGGALRLTAVYSCIRLLSETVAGIPIELVRKLPDGSREVISDHHTVDLIRHRPSPAMSAMVFKETMMGQALSNGNAIALILRNEAGQAEELVYYRTGDVSITKINRQLWYRFPDFKDPVAWYDVIHVQAFGTEGYKGLSPIAQHATTINSALEAQDFNGKFYKNGGWLKGILESAGPLAPGRPKELSTEWDANFGGPENAYKTPVTHSGLKFSPIQINQRDAQYIEHMKFTREQIASIYNVHPSMIGDTQSTNFSVMEQQDIQYVKYALRPWLKKWEQEYNFKLLTAAERRQGYQYKFNVNALLRGDIKTRSEFYTKMIAHGVMSPNEVRALENLNPRDGGDKFFTQVNTQTQTQTSLQEEKLEAEVDNLKNQGDE